MKQLVLILMMLCTPFCFAQKAQVDWLSIEDLERELVSKSKKVMIHFYADWCNYCKKMERSVYTRPEIVDELSTNYYAVKFNVETQDTIQFGGKTFVNLNVGKKRNAFHQIAELLVSQKDQSLTLPAIVFFDKSFEIEERQFRYIAPDELLRLLQE